MASAASFVYVGLAGTVRADLLGRSAVRGREGELNIYRVAVLQDHN